MRAKDIQRERKKEEEEKEKEEEEEAEEEEEEEKEEKKKKRKNSQMLKNMKEMYHVPWDFKTGHQTQNEEGAGPVAQAIGTPCS